MDDNTEYREISAFEEDCQEGLLFKAWTDKWGLKVSPWYEMDRVKFSFIEKGVGGKGKSFDVCISAQQNHSFDFMTLSHEVLHDIPTPFDFIKIMEDEHAAGEKYPKRYQFTTGHNGEKSVGICNSSTGDGYCINASTVVKGKKIYAYVPVSYYDIYRMVAAFRETYSQREQELRKIRQEAIRTRGERIEAAKREKISEPLSVCSLSSLNEQQNGDFVLAARTGEGKDISIRITKDAINRMNEKNANMFDAFQKRTAEKETSFSFFGKQLAGANHGTEYVFEKFFCPTKS